MAPCGFVAFLAKVPYIGCGTRRATKSHVGALST